MHRTVGLDFGTTTTLLAAEGSLVPLGTRLDPWLPSLVGLVDDGSVVVGEAAEEAVSAEIVRSVKRAITKRWNEVRDSAVARLGRVTADDLILEVLREVDARALRHGVDLAEPGPMNVGCPAVWDSGQRDRLRRLLARVFPARTITLVDEPVAAGIAWLVGQPSLAHPTRVLVFDMGGGTLDIAVLDVRGAGNREISVLAALGVSEAGDALDEAIADDLDFALARLGLDTDALARPDRARELLLDAARRVKVRLTTEEEAPVPLLRETFGRIDLWYTREQLTAVFGRQMERAEQYVAAALRVAHLSQQAGRTAHDIARLPIEELVDGVDLVLLSGGMSQIPHVPQRLRQLFPATTRIEPAAANPAHAVALGLARVEGYGRLNRYRPAFDVVLEWDEGRRRRTIYEAFTPLVEVTQIVRGSADLRFTRTGADLSVPRTGAGTLRVRSYSGAAVRAGLDGEQLDGFPVRFGEEFELSLYPNGRIRIVDAAGAHEGRIEDWPV